VQLELTLPTLGKVAAEVALNGDNLALRLHGDASALPALQRARGELAATLGAHRLAVSPIKISHGD
jgi:hypothetical protein